MKKIICTLLVIITVFTAANAQYKKASFFLRNSKFYGINTGAHLYGNGVSVAPVIGFVSGRDRGKTHIWHWWDYEFVLKSNYKYTSPDVTPSKPDVTVTGKTSSTFNIRYNWCYYLGNNQNDDVKGLPYVKAGLHLSILAREAKLGYQTVTPATGDPAKNPYNYSGGFGADLGLGYVYRISEKSTFFCAAGYRLMLGPDKDEKATSFHIAPNHPYINAGIRFAKKNKD
jgi:hypothetical protein